MGPAAGGHQPAGCRCSWPRALLPTGKVLLVAGGTQRYEILEEDVTGQRAARRPQTDA